jgi:exonuclease SbcC
VALILGKFNDDTDESNGSGKTSMLEGIRWILFDKSRHKTKDKVVKRDAKSCSVSFEFQIDQEIYKIIRKRNKVVSESDVLLFQWDGSGWTNISCDTNGATNIKIIKLINFNHEIFINSVYFKQGDISLFTDSTAGKRKDIIKSLMKLEIWDEYQKKAKMYAKNYALKIEEKKSGLINISQIDEETEKLNVKIENLKYSIQTKNSLYDTISADLVAKKSAYNLIIDFDVKARLKEAQSKYQSERARLNNLSFKANNNKKSLHRLENLLAEQNSKAEQLKQQINTKKLTDLKKARFGLIQGRTKEQVLKQKITDLQKNINLKKCETCLRPIRNAQIANEIKQKRKKELKKNRAEYTRISKKLKIAENKFRKLEKNHKLKNDMIIALNKILIKIASTENLLSGLNTEKVKINAEMGQINPKQCKKDIEDIKSKYNKTNIDEMTLKIDEAEEEIEKLRSLIDELNVQYGSCINAQKDLIKKKRYQIKIQKELNDLNEQFLLYDKLKNYFGKDGVQSIIIENVVNELENYSNQVLAKICNEPTTVAIQMQRQNNKGTWSETFDIEVNINGITDDLESLSGGEKFRISLALRLALSKILSKRMGGVIKFLLLDEVSSSLDNKGLNIFADIVLKLGNEMKVLIISHDNRLRQQIPDIIMVSKDNSGSSANI